MLGIDISALSLGELKQLADVARVRGQSGLAEALAAELRNRPLRAAGWREGAWGAAIVAPLPVPRTSLRRRTSPPLWATAACATLALGLGWGLSLPEASQQDLLGFGLEAPNLAEALLVGTLCATGPAMAEGRDCGAPTPLADMGPVTGGAPPT